MQERFKEYEEFVDRRLKNRGFIRTIYEEVEAFALLFQGVSKDEVFRRLAMGKGVGKPHCSNKKYGKLKNS